MTGNLLVKTRANASDMYQNVAYTLEHVLRGWMSKGFAAVCHDHL